MIKATCTWGDGPDVLLEINDKLYDLSANEAFELATVLMMAANQAHALEVTANEQTIC